MSNKPLTDRIEITTDGQKEKLANLPKLDFPVFEIYDDIKPLTDRILELPDGEWRLEFTDLKRVYPTSIGLAELKSLARDYVQLQKDFAILFGKYDVISKSYPFLVRSHKDIIAVAKGILEVAEPYSDTLDFMRGDLVHLRSAVEEGEKLV